MEQTTATASGLSQQLSRRNFLKASGLSAMALGLAPAAGLAGEQEQAEASEDTADATGAADAAGAEVSDDELTFELIKEADDVLEGSVVIPTPLVPLSYTIDGCPQVFLKLENLQHTNCFKLRGAYFRISRLTDEEKARGVVTSSAGNHAQGVGYASRAFGIDATIFIPAIAPQSKIDRTRSYGVDVRIVDGSFEDSLQAAQDFAEETGAIFVPPYNDVCVMAGQGTIGIEIMEERDDLDAIVVPVGGGGLIAGIAMAVKTINPDIKVYGVESEGAPSMHESLAAGEPVTVATVESLADGLDVARPGDLTFAVAQEYVDDVFVVNETQIAQAMKTLALEGKIVAEGAGACAFAAVCAGLIPLGPDAKVACVVSGGNVNATTLSDIILD